MAKCEYKAEYSRPDEIINYKCPHNALNSPDKDGKKHCIYHSKKEKKKRFYKKFKKLYEDGSHNFLGFIFPESFDFGRLKDETGPLKFIDANFDKSIILCDVDLSGSEFTGGGETSFYEAKFSGKGRTDFSESHFKCEGETSFFATKFSGEGWTSFSGAKFFSKKRTTFGAADFSCNGGTSFSGAQFHNKGDVVFSSVDFSGKGQIDFSGAQFSCEGKTSFSRVQFTNEGRTLFRSTIFSNKETTDFSEAQFSSMGGTSFREAEFLIEPLFSKVVFLEKPDFSDTIISGNPNFNWTDFLNKNDCYITLSFKGFKKEFMDDKDQIKKPSIFLCHSSKDKRFVRNLAEKLKEHGVYVWFDEMKIDIGDSLIEKIGKAIQEIDYFAVIISKSSINSEWVKKELREALDMEIEKGETFVLPLLKDKIEKEDMPPFLRDKLYADFTSPNKYEKSFKKLLKTLGVETV